MSFADAKSGACEEDKQRKIVIMRKQNPQHRLFVDTVLKVTVTTYTLALNFPPTFISI